MPKLFCNRRQSFPIFLKIMLKPRGNISSTISILVEENIVGVSPLRRLCCGNREVCGDLDLDFEGLRLALWNKREHTLGVGWVLKHLLAYFEVALDVSEFY